MPIGFDPDPIQELIDLRIVGQADHWHGLIGRIDKRMQAHAQQRVTPADLQQHLLGVVARLGDLGDGLRRDRRAAPSPTRDASASKGVWNGRKRSRTARLRASAPSASAARARSAPSLRQWRKDTPTSGSAPLPPEARRPPGPPPA